MRTIPLPLRAHDESFRARRAAVTTPRIVVVFRNDDPSGCSDVDHERRVADVFDRYGFPQTLGVIPLSTADSQHDRFGTRYAPLEANPAIVRFLTEYAAASGSELALHGYTHRTNRFSNPARREYFEFRRISLAEQEELIAKGADTLTRLLGVRPRTFIPPWNRLDVNTVRACARQRFTVVSSGAFAPDDGILALGTDCDLRSLPRRLQTAPDDSGRIILRVLYHSRSTRTPDELAELDTALRATAETPDCAVMTIDEIADRFPDEVRCINAAARNIVAQDEVAGSPRARVTLYRRAMPFSATARQLNGAYAEAKAQYDDGRYLSAERLSPRIDEGCRRLLTTGRWLGVGVGLVAGLVAGNVVTPGGHASFPLAFGVMTATAALCGFAAWHGSTAQDTRDEVTLLATMGWLAGIAGLALAELLKPVG